MSHPFDRHPEEFVEDESDIESIAPTEVIDDLLEQDVFEEDDELPSLPESYFYDSEDSEQEDFYPVGQWYAPRHPHHLSFQNVVADRHSWRPVRRNEWQGSEVILLFSDSEDREDSESVSSDSDDIEESESDYFSDW